MDVLSSTLLSGVGAIAILIGYGAIRKERLSGQRAQPGQSAGEIAREHATLKTKHQQITVANRTLQQQVETLIAEKTALQKTLDHAWEKTAELEAQLTRKNTATEQLNPSAPEPITQLESQISDTETTPAPLMPKPSLPHKEEASGPALPAAHTITDSSETAQDLSLSSTDTPVDKEIATIYEIEDAIAIEDNIHEQAISAEPNPLQGKSIAISGIFKEITPTEIKERLQSVGGRLQVESNTNTDYMIVGSIPSDKPQRAEKLKIPQLTEAQFLNLLQESELLVRARS